MRRGLVLCRATTVRADRKAGPARAHGRWHISPRPAFRLGHLCGVAAARWRTPGNCVTQGKPVEKLSLARWRVRACGLLSGARGLPLPLDMVTSGPGPTPTSGLGPLHVSTPPTVRLRPSQPWRRCRQTVPRRAPHAETVQKTCAPSTCPAPAKPVARPVASPLPRRQQCRQGRAGGPVVWPWISFRRNPVRRAALSNQVATTARCLLRCEGLGQCPWPLSPSRSRSPGRQRAVEN